MSLKISAVIEEIKTEKYINLLSENKNDNFKALTTIFSNFNKLSKNLNEDKKYLENFLTLLENEEEDDFDPFSHLEQTEKIDVDRDCVLSFTKSGNSKIAVPFFSLPAGYSCPFAEVCKSIVPRDRKKTKGKLIQDKGDIRCFAASSEARYPNVQKRNWRNKDLLDQKDFNGKVDLILESLDYFERNTGKITILRVHESGDFYSQEYFNAWVEVAKRRPDILFYAYTKSLRFWVSKIGEISNNFKLIASYGGKDDSLIDEYNLRYVKIVDTPEEAKKLKLRIDVNDKIAYGSNENFALLLHGSQKAGTERAKQAYKNRAIINKYKKLQ